MNATIEKIEVVHRYDDNPDTSWIGEFTDDVGDGWVIIRHGEHSGEYVALLPDDADLPNRGREYRYFRPEAGGEKAGTDDYRKYGLQDWERMEGLASGQWGFIGVCLRATVKVAVSSTYNRIDRFESSSVWGVESDSDEGIAEVVRDEVDSLREYLAALGVPLDNFDVLVKVALDNDPVWE